MKNALLSASSIAPIGAMLFPVAIPTLIWQSRNRLGKRAGGHTAQSSKKNGDAALAPLESVVARSYYLNRIIRYATNTANYSPDRRRLLLRFSTLQRAVSFDGPLAFPVSRDISQARFIREGELRL
jgi:hypothetical protein